MRAHAQYALTLARRGAKRATPPTKASLFIHASLFFVKMTVLKIVIVVHRSYGNEGRSHAYHVLDCDFQYPSYNFKNETFYQAWYRSLIYLIIHTKKIVTQN